MAAEPDRVPMLRDAILEFVNVRATAADLLTTEALQAMQEALAILLLEVAHTQSKSPRRREHIYRRASEFQLAQCLDIDQRTTRHTEALLKRGRSPG